MLVRDELQLTGRRVGEIEDKIGAGLIEEVIDVAQGELNLVDTMEKNQVYVSSRPVRHHKPILNNHRWEDLEEKPVEGQWVYFERK